MNAPEFPDVWESYPLATLVVLMSCPLLVWFVDGLVYWSNS